MMRITKIRARSFLGLDKLDMAIERPLVLVAGPNASGKTSVAHALRFVLDNDLVRVEHKKNVKSLIREGAKLGQVSVSVMNGGDAAGTVYEYTRSAATGHYTSESPPPAPHPVLRYCLDPPAFVALTPNERRTFLFDLMGVKMSRESIIEQLHARGHASDLVRRIAHHLKSGFHAAHTEAQGLAREAKGQWRGVTGEDYGTVKADSWALSAPEVEDSDIDRLKADLRAHDQTLQELQREAGAVKERRAQQQRLTERMAHTSGIASQFKARQTALDTAQKRIAEITEEERACRAKLAEAQAKTTIQAHVTQGTFFTCPECGASLVLSQGVCKCGVPSADAIAEVAASEHEVRELNLSLSEITNRKRIADHLVVDAINALGESRTAVGTLADLGSPEEIAGPAGLDEKIESAAAASAEIDRALRGLLERRAAHENAVTKTREAKEIHERIKALSALAADLAPDGLPAELLAKAMRPINERLRDSAVMAGWSSVSITTDEILVHGRPWALASESERWRAMAMIAEAIAYLSGIKCFVLDGMDILDAPSRGQAMGWLLEVASEHHTIIALATLKAPPVFESSEERLQTVWLGGIQGVARA